ncbi:hypothetical protein OH799_16165 [Nocardia sp. NBC_00881]|uniref:hypothetical protein n=1 Tax=Nocardia sp. NBC_00881 TaxID=2975995 RepID=UPI00386671AC|nr:hypothetical protein OH799_16165 [Nocardia sp. NBC_00881]
MPLRSWVSGPSETIALTVAFPPTSVYAVPDSTRLLAAEQLEALPWPCRAVRAGDHDRQPEAVLIHEGTVETHMPMIGRAL